MKIVKPKQNKLCFFSFEGNYPEIDSQNPNILYYYPEGKKHNYYKIDIKNARQSITASVGEEVLWTLAVEPEQVTILKPH